MSLKVKYGWNIILSIFGLNNKRFITIAKTIIGKVKWKVQNRVNRIVLNKFLDMWLLKVNL